MLACHDANSGLRGRLWGCLCGPNSGDALPSASRAASQTRASAGGLCPLWWTYTESPLCPRSHWLRLGVPYHLWVHAPSVLRLFPSSPRRSRDRRKPLAHRSYYARWWRQPPVPTPSSCPIEKHVKGGSRWRLGIDVGVDQLSALDAVLGRPRRLHQTRLYELADQHSARRASGGALPVVSSLHTSSHVPTTAVAQMFSGGAARWAAGTLRGLAARPRNLITGTARVSPAATKDARCQASACGLSRARRGGAVLLLGTRAARLCVLEVEAGRTMSRV